jgi:RNA polymerase sigma factor (sigma-70 family)
MRYHVDRIVLPSQPMTMAPNTATVRFVDFLQTHGPLLARLCDGSGAARWQVSSDDFAHALYRSASHRFGPSLPGGETLADYFSALHLSDLALACALRIGSAAAWEEFIAGYRPVLYAAARAVVGSAAGEARARELADSLYAELYGLNRAAKGSGTGAQTADRRPLLDYFHGRSKLSTWLRAVLAQRHVDALRSGRRTDSLDDESPLHVRLARQSATPAGAGDPDRQRLLPRLRQAVSATLSAVPPADRLLLSLYYVQEMTLAQIARVQGMHEATISRQIERIRRDLRSGVEQRLAANLGANDGASAQPGLSPAEIDLCFTYATEDWSFDLRGALSGKAAARQEDY